MFNEEEYICKIYGKDVYEAVRVFGNDFHVDLSTRYRYQSPWEPSIWRESIILKGENPDVIIKLEMGFRSGGEQNLPRLTYIDNRVENQPINYIVEKRVWGPEVGGATDAPDNRCVVTADEDKINFWNNESLNQYELYYNHSCDFLEKDRHLGHPRAFERALIYPDDTVALTEDKSVFAQLTEYFKAKVIDKQMALKKQK